MCGRVVQALDPDFLASFFEAKRLVDAFQPNWNLAPSQTAAVLRLNPETRERVFSTLRWGLVPGDTDANHKYSTFNAKSETLAEKPLYRHAWQHGQRCIIPIEAFYEWLLLKKGAPKQPFAIVSSAPGEPLALAGLWEGKVLPDGEILRTFTVITCPANDAMAPVHDRMPVILPREAWATWLGETRASEAEVAALMQPCPNDGLKLFPVAPLDLRTNGPEHLTPIDLDLKLNTRHERRQVSA